MSINESKMKWDKYFHSICQTVAQNSSCLSRKIGAILVKDNSIISSGYNGPPRGVKHCNERYIIDNELRGYLKSQKIDPDNEAIHNVCPRQVLGFKSGEGLHLCIAGHAERNTLINAARHGIKTKNCKIYMDCGVPCTPCLVEIINAGIEEIIITKKSFYDTSSQYLLDNCNLTVRIYTHLCEHKNYIANVCLDCGSFIK